MVNYLDEKLHQIRHIEREEKKRKRKRELERQASFQGQRVWSLLINKCYFDQRSCVTVRPCANGTLSWVLPQSLMGVSRRACKQSDPSNPQSHSHLSWALLISQSVPKQLHTLSSQSNQPNITFNIKHCGGFRYWKEIPLSHAIVSYHPRCWGCWYWLQNCSGNGLTGLAPGWHRTHVSGQMVPDRFGAQPQGNATFAWEALGCLLLIK